MKFTKDGETIDIAFDELALFFNNNTILYGCKQYEAGMSKAEYTTALEAAGFEPVLAKAFADKYWNTHALWGTDSG